ncbi:MULTISPECIES: aspartate--tRNA ligase [Petrotoga]|uniref:Aspartate--tRNA ligase n=2 Tax=Petrotoga sibirica TaxID=156202 RepID=A0A4R8F4H5_9BACT|nr:MULTISPECIES: aspartate--tRNA ligase [Petrotoga]POZ87988.1 aspartyl-tRNA synthetase [Petrotoga sibirica DSM 13575]POZ90078.1 aspartyl-tRNA synthetase [Petrotoga sp. SL27]TDX17071.1 aspartyl-tRNA synthetase [Petrotoga sibirica]
MFQKRTHTCGELNEIDIDKIVILNGWIDRIRDLGGIIFVLIRDRYGKTQAVFDSSYNNALYQKALKLKNEYVVSIQGKVRARPEKDRNPNMFTGNIEILATNLEILSESETPPIYVNIEEDISENLRLKYRYLDLRKERMQKNIIVRHKVMKSTRDMLSAEGFLEIDTPYLTKSTPEGARDFLVPSRLRPGNFYALPQSPQLFKQLLMVSGFDKYFQIARCFRDEDFRADRQPEFTQIDIEQSFVEKEDIFALTEKLIKEIFEKSINYKGLEIPFPKYTYDEVIQKYGSDKPDIRYGMEFIDLTAYFQNTETNFIKNGIDKGLILKGFVVPEKVDNFSRKKFDNLTEFAKEQGSSGLIWIAFDKEIRSNIKKAAAKEINILVEHGIMREGDILFAILEEKNKIDQILGQLRIKMIKEEFEKKSGFSIIWVTDFPMFSWNEEEQRIVAEHHPFTMPNLDDLAKYKNKDPLKIKSQSYDLVINGYEIASGSIRIHKKDVQEKVFDILGLSKEEAQEKFGFLLEAFKYGAPPHGGIAIGMDRLVSILVGEESIKEVIAFPKTASGTDPMTGAPSEVSEKQLEELQLALKKTNKSEMQNDSRS